MLHIKLNCSFTSDLKDKFVVKQIFYLMNRNYEELSRNFIDCRVM